MPVSDFGETQLPAGTIAVWAGLLSDIPSGWVLCDGMNGTPNLLDDYVREVPDDATTPGTVKGQHSYTVSESQMGPHDHPVDTTNDGSHDHGLNAEYNADGYGVGETAFGGGGTGATTGTSGDHSHPINDDVAGSDNTVSNHPQYYEVAFIQKV